MSEPEARTVRSFCRICTCQCGILVDVVGDRVTRIRGDRDNPMTFGYTCVKGRALPEMHHHPRRLERPMLREGGALREAGWQETLDDLGDRLRRVLDDHGPSSVAVFFGSGLGMDAAGYRTAERLFAALGTPARMSPLTIDGTAKVLAATMVGGFAGLSPRPDYDNLTLLLYFGVNPVVSHGHALAMPSPTTTLRGLRSQAEIWVVDPRRTETAALADGHLASRPNTDYAILAFLVREMLPSADPDLLAHRTIGVDELRAAVKPFTAEHSAQIAGVPIEQLQDLLAAVRRAGRLAVDVGTGITMSQGANVATWLAWVLMVITDSMNRPGGVWFHPGFFMQLDGMDIPVLPPEVYFAAGPPSRPDLPGFLGEWPCAALASEINAGNIRAVLNLGGGLLTAFPDANVLRPALQKLDVLATLEIMNNEVTALSTHVLPTKDQMERADINLWDFLSPRVVAQYSPAVVEPVGDRRSSWWVLAELGRRLGHDFTAGLPTDDGPASDDLLLSRQVAHGRCSWEELQDSEYVERPLEFPAPWVENFLDRSGGWRLAPAQLVEQLAAMAGPPDLSLLPRRQTRHVNSQLTYLGDRPDVLLHPDDAAAAKVADGEPVIVRSASGEIVAYAKLDPSIRRGAVSVPHGYETANVNELTSHLDADPLTGMAHYSGVAVQVERVSADQTN
jgi:anaerobic selenocysteine-containing dehydrogenase